MAAHGQATPRLSYARPEAAQDRQCQHRRRVTESDRRPSRMDRSPADMDGCVVMVGSADDRADVDDLHGQGHGRRPGCLMRAGGVLADCTMAIDSSVSARRPLLFGGKGLQPEAEQWRKGHGIRQDCRLTEALSA